MARNFTQRRQAAKDRIKTFRLLDSDSCVLIFHFSFLLSAFCFLLLCNDFLIFEY
jgi:hypothetical protein